MDNYIFAWLFDIKNSIEEIESYFPNGKVFQYYHEDLKLNVLLKGILKLLAKQ